MKTATLPRPETAATSVDTPSFLARVLPGVGLCVAVTLAALALEHVEAALFGRAWLEALVLAILIGTMVRTAWTPGARWRGGIDFSAKTLLEVAVVLLGASVSAATVIAIGPWMLLGIAGVVAVAILASYGIGRLLGLPVRMALLVACGNSICGNSAIAAVAPVIGADGDDVAASIAFTAVLGVLAVLGLPLLAPLLGLTGHQYGVLAGLTVYAVPQVLAATAPVAAIAVQVGTLVKLVRVLMLGPVVLVLSLLAPRLGEETDEPAPHVTAGERPKAGRLPLHRLLPFDPAKGEEGIGAQGAILVLLLGIIAAVAPRGLGRVDEGFNRWTWAALGLVVLTLAVAAMGMQPQGGGVTLHMTGRMLGVVAAMAAIAWVAHRHIDRRALRALRNAPEASALA